MNQEELSYLRERIKSGIDDETLMNLIPLAIPSKQNTFKLVLQQNYDLNSVERQNKALDIYLKEIA